MSTRSPRAASYAEYAVFAERLKAIGFREDTSEGAPVCRWVKGDTILDVMPLDERTLGFTNTWYRPAMETADKHQIIRGMTIKVVAPVYFCATKMEAFDGRGKNDFLGSHDLEDIIAVIDGREEIIEEIKDASENVRYYIAGKIDEWLNNDKFIDALPGHLGNASDRGRLGIILKRLQQIAALKENRN